MLGNMISISNGGDETFQINVESLLGSNVNPAQQLSLSLGIFANNGIVQSKSVNNANATVMRN